VTADVELVPFAEEHTEGLVDMWRASFERAVRVADPHPIEEQRAYLLTKVVPSNEVLVAVADAAVVGFVAASGESIAQLYVHPDWQRRGLGTRLLQWAKDRSGGRLWLYTFARNRLARSFYESHGFRIVARGFEPEWRLADLRYEWTADDGA
jgi:ribosomal protein S18 acetylase RimI-like enzyme